MASICCRIITTIAIANAFPSPPVINVIKIPIPTATIAPIYGIILNNPIVNPINGAYFTFNINIAIVVNIPTITASNNWLDTNVKNTSFPFVKYLSTASYVSFLNIALANFLKNPTISLLCNKI